MRPDWKELDVNLAYFFSNHNQLEATAYQSVKGLSLMVFLLNGDTIKYRLSRGVKIVGRKPTVLYTRSFEGNDKIDKVVLFKKDPINNPDYVVSFDDPRLKGILL